MPSKATELINILNTTLKTEVAKSASNEVYKSGFWSTGQLPIDVCLGGGWAKGRMGLLYGESATLKSLIGLSTAAQVQRSGGVAAYFDLEHSFDQDWATKIGINNDDLILMQPTTGEEAMDQAEILVRNDIDYICVDSIAALLPKSEHELQLSGKDNNQPANTARLMSLALRKLNSANNKTCINWITQMRDNIGGMSFGPRTNATGGKAKHFYVSQELALKKIDKVYESVTYFTGQKDETYKQVIQQNFRSELTKSRFGQPFIVQNFVFDLRYGQIDAISYLIQQGLELGYITKNATGSWVLTIADNDGVVLFEEKVRGKDNFRELINSRLDIQQTLLSIVCKKYNLQEENYDLQFGVYNTN